jgi:hypothetical protein
LTLSAVLMLGGVTGGRGDELSDSVGLGNASPSGAFVLPTLPENWADMPFQLTANEVVSYNSNIFGVPTNTVLPPGEQRGDWTSTSTVGLSTRSYWYGQQFFFSGTYGLIRYLHRTEDDSNIYSFNGGVNWTLTSRCAGSVAANLSKAPTLITEQVGTGINYATTTGVNETGKCDVSNGYSLIVNSGWSKTTNSGGLNAANNGETVMVAAGIEYAKAQDTLTALATISNTNYGNRTGLLTTPIIGLANSVALHSFTLTYARQIDPDLSVVAQVGLTGVTSGFELSLPKTLLPIYSLSATWAVTPKVGLTASASRTVAAPTTVIANAETTYQATVGLTYQATPKVTFGATASAARTNEAFTAGLAGAINSTFFSATDYYSANGSVTYTMTPFLSAGLTASYLQRVSNHFMTPQDVITLSLNYAPH